MSFSDAALEILKQSADYAGAHEQSVIVFPEELDALIARLEAAEDLHAFTAHESDCILTFREAGEPTPDGGYRTKYAGKWYQSRPADHTPKCNCGLDETWNAWRKAAGK